MVPTRMEFPPRRPRGVGFPHHQNRLAEGIALSCTPPESVSTKWQRDSTRTNGTNREGPANGCANGCRAPPVPVPAHSDWGERKEYEAVLSGGELLQPPKRYVNAAVEILPAMRLTRIARRFGPASNSGPSRASWTQPCFSIRCLMSSSASMTVVAGDENAVPWQVFTLSASAARW